MSAYTSFALFLLHLINAILVQTIKNQVYFTSRCPSKGNVVPMVIYCKMEREEGRHGEVIFNFYGLAVRGY